MSRPVMSIGIECPMIRENDDLPKIVVESVLKSGHELNDLDVIGITESVVARSQGNYVTLDDLALEINKLFGPKSSVCLINPIYSRNRFAMILKGIARSAGKIYITMPKFDEVGNPRENHPFTGFDYREYYKNLIESEGCKCEILDIFTVEDFRYKDKINYIYCGLHDFDTWLGDHLYFNSGWSLSEENYNDPLKTDFENWREKYDAGGYNMISDSEGLIIGCLKVITLAEIFNSKCEYGLLGSNKATEERLKLFPSKSRAQNVCDNVKLKLKEKTGKDVVICVYGDGCYKDASSEIWEFADPITMPGYTNPELIESTPNEIKLKALIDSSASDAEVRRGLAAKEKDLKGNMKSQGTTPRLCRDLLASLMDLTSGSGDRETPVVLVKGYF